MRSVPIRLAQLAVASSVAITLTFAATEARDRSPIFRPMSWLAARPTTIASEDTVEVVTTHVCTRTAGGAVTTCSQGFTATPTAGRRFVLLLDNGNANGTQRASGVSVVINGREWVGLGELTLSTASMDRTVDLAASNTLDLSVRGAIGAFIRFRLVSVIDPTLRIFGVETFTRAAGAPTTEVRMLTVPPGAGGPFTIAVTNGAPNGSQRAAGATLKLNGATVVGPGELHAEVAVLERQVQIYSSDTLEVRVAGATGAQVSVELRAVDIAPPVLAVTAPPEGTFTGATSVEVSGTATDDHPLTLTVNGAPVTVGQGGAFTQQVALALGDNTITVLAQDVLGQSTTVIRHVTREAVIAPPVVQGLPTTYIAPFRAAYAYLFRPPGGTQFGFDSTRFTSQRAAVLRGVVMNANGTTLPNVRVEVLGQTPLGWTKTRDDGAWDLMVAGGGPLTVSFTRAGFIASQRRLDAPFRDVAVLDTVRMAPYDTTVSTIAFAQPVEVARSSVVTDADGARQATLMFEQGTTATMVMPNGSTQPLTTLHVRSTEFTVGPNGLQAMPAALPATSAYTYCTDLSVDEAVAAGATDVTFSKPVAFYVENFLELPVGTRLPVGSYDRKRGVWVPELDGVTIKIVGRDSSRALVDLNGDGNADPPSELLAEGMDEAERAKLAELYPDGTQLWRMEAQHFSPWDINMGLALIDGSIPPELDDLKKLLQSLNCQSKKSGSVIDCESRVLGESVPMVGTPFTLNYRASRAPGFAAARHVSVQIVGPTVPSVLSFVRVLVHVAGTVHSHDYSRSQLTPFQRHEFTWNGLDAQGRPVRGAVNAVVDVEWHYPTVMATAGNAARGVRSFGRPPRGPAFSLSTRGFDGVYRVRQEVGLGAFEMTQAGLGGWSIDVHHVYDNNGKGTMYLGDGERLSGERMRPKVEVGAPYAVSITDVAIGPDGSIYYTGDVNQIHRIRPTGQNLIFYTAPFTLVGSHMAVADSDSILITLPGQSRVVTLRNGTLQPFLGIQNQSALPTEGAIAESTTVRRPHGIVMGPDGCVYVSDEDAHCIWRVSPDKRVSRYAGTPNTPSNPIQPSTLGDGGFATNAKLNLPRSMTFGPDGSLYLADSGDWRVRRIRPDGIITTFAGISNGGTSGDGGLAINAAIGDVTSVAFGPDGSFYAMASIGSRIRQISPAGFISSVIGHGVQNGCCYGGPAAASDLGWPNKIAFDQEGRLWIANTFPPIYFSNLLVVMPILPGFNAADFLMPSRDGAEVYQFDASGRHLRTLDGLTGAVRYRFGYNAAGQLTSIADPANLTTTIQRDGAGNPTAIVGPFGHTTTLQTDPNGFLTRVTDPSGSFTKIVPDGGGMLQRIESPRGFGTDFTYDGEGLLNVESDPAGGSQTLTGGVVLDSLAHVTHTTGEGRLTVYDLLDKRNGTLVRTTTNPAGLVTTGVETPEGVEGTTVPEGAYRRALQVNDPRLGMAAPILDSLTIATGSKLLRIDGQRTYENNAGPLYSYTRLRDQTVVNGKTWVSAFDRVPRRLTEVSPEGRQIVTVVDSVGRPLRIRMAGLDSLVLGYDPQGRVTSVTQGPRVWSYAYEDSGRLETITDPLLRQFTLRYDADDRLIREELPGAVQVGLDYDDSGNLTALTPPSRPTHAFSHTPVELVQSYAPPVVSGGGSTGYGYDLDRDPTTVTRPGGEVVELDYDGAGRLQQLTHAHDRVVLGYHPTTGLPTSAASDSGASLGYGYSGALPQSESWTLSGAGTVSLSVGYDDDFQVEMQTVAGDTAGFSYDRDGVLVRAGPERLVRAPSNGLLQRTEVAALITEYGYDGAGELIELQTRTTGGQVIYQEGLTRDLAGRVTSRRDSMWTGSGFQTRTDVYGYDPAGRLATVTRDGSLIATYGYDANGNRISFQGASPADTATANYDAQDRLLRYEDAAFTHTANGELQSKTDGADVTQYQYDAMGALRRVTLPSGAALEYAIDAQGRRVGRGDPGSPSQRWVYQSASNVVAELNAAGALTKRFVYGSRGHVPDLMKQGGTIYRLVTDHLGSVVAVVDAATGTIAGRKRYDAWGVVEEDTSPGLVPFGFAGGLTDGTTSLVRFGARDYDPATGRWTTKDPIGFEGGENQYAYVFDNPVGEVDPTGLGASGGVRAVACVGDLAVQQTAVGKAAALAGVELKPFSMFLGEPPVEFTPGSIAEAVFDHTGNAFEDAANSLDAKKAIDRAGRRSTRTAQPKERAQRLAKAAHFERLGRIATIVKTGEKALNILNVAIGIKDCACELLDRKP